MTEHFDDPDEAELFTRLSALAKDLTEADATLTTPPPAVWDSIEAELAGEATAAATADEPAVRLRSVEGGTGAPDAPAAAAEPSPAGLGDDGVVVPFRPRKAIMAAAAAAAVFVGAVVGIGALTGDDDPEPFAVANLVNDELDPAGVGLDGVAEVIVDGDSRQIRLDVSEWPEVDGHYELWVINADVTDMHSLGRVSADGTIDLPPGVTTEEFPIVDISIEQDDGDETHSGRSILRGVADKTA